MNTEKKGKFSFFSKKKNDESFNPSEYQEEPKIQFSEREGKVLNLNFIKKARYRCTQTNITKALDNVTFSAEIKSQYLLSMAEAQSKYYHIKIEDYIYSIDPKAMEAVFQILEPVEYIRNNIVFSQNENAEIEKIPNIAQLNRAWQNFKNNKLTSLKFYKKLKKENSKIADDILKTGDIELSDINTLKTNLDKNLFYHIFLKANAGNELKDFTISQISQLFPHQNLVVDVVKSTINQNASIITFGLVGTLNRKKLSDEQLEKQYNEIYKPMIKYSFTEFDYLYRITYTIQAKTGLLLEATAFLSEKIKNNFECITQFQIKKVEL